MKSDKYLFNVNINHINDRWVHDVSSSLLILYFRNILAMSIM